jgi:preprotein translocase subunit YajC
MSTFNTLLFIQADAPAEGQNENQGQTVFQQGETQAESALVTEQPGTPVTAAPVQKEEGKSWGNWLFILLIIVVFYFFLIRPQSKRAKEERKFREALKKGDKIVTTAGIHGKIVELDETTAVIETEGQGKLRIEKAAIAKQQPA